MREVGVDVLGGVEGVVLHAGGEHDGGEGGDELLPGAGGGGEAGDVPLLPAGQAGMEPHQLGILGHSLRGGELGWVAPGRWDRRRPRPP